MRKPVLSAILTFVLFLSTACIPASEIEPAPAATVAAAAATVASARSTEAVAVRAIAQVTAPAPEANLAAASPTPIPTAEPTETASAPDATATPESPLPLDTATPAVTPTVATTATTPTTTATATIEGQVIQSEIGEAIAGARVSLGQPGSESENTAYDIIATTLTDERGNFVFENVAPGEYAMGITVEYTDSDDVPCGVGSNAAFTVDDWVRVVTTRASGESYLVVFSGSNFELEADAMYREEIDLSCEF